MQFVIYCLTPLTKSILC